MAADAGLASSAVRFLALGFQDLVAVARNLFAPEAELGGTRLALASEIAHAWSATATIEESSMQNTRRRLGHVGMTELEASLLLSDWQDLAGIMARLQENSHLESGYMRLADMQLDACRRLDRLFWRGRGIALPEIAASFVWVAGQHVRFFTPGTWPKRYAGPEEWGLAACYLFPCVTLQSAENKTVPPVFGRFGGRAAAFRFAMRERVEWTSGIAHRDQERATTGLKLLGFGVSSYFLCLRSRRRSRLIGLNRAWKHLGGS